jgi:hypothetical protein|tara:strand:+ start:687 stop:1352 length:666 start_codon:yes stop_codon:yes gene_type:complete
MSKILTSGCGITFPGERPTWVNVLKICGLNVKDLSGPAISNTLILNQLITECNKTRYDYVICQLTSKKKLDIELNDHNKKYMDGDPLRNFSYKGFWPSSVGADNDIKRMYYKYLYSPKLDEDDTILKLMLLQHICKQHQSELFIMQGYEMHWTNKMIKNINMDINFVIENDYKQSKFYSTHDFTNSNTVPNKLYQIHLAKYINQNFLQLYGLNEKLEKFNV